MKNESKAWWNTPVIPVLLEGLRQENLKFQPSLRSLFSETLAQNKKIQRAWDVAQCESSGLDPQCPTPQKRVKGQMGLIMSGPHGEQVFF